MREAAEVAHHQAAEVATTTTRFLIRVIASVVNRNNQAVKDQKWCRRPAVLFGRRHMTRRTNQCLR